MRLLKIPYDGGGMGHGNGSKEAPKKIIAALSDIYLNETGIKPAFEYVDVRVDNTNATLSQESIIKSVTKEPFVALGGDHSVTYSLVRGFAKVHDDIKFIVFDAHPDVVNYFHPPSQEDYLKTLIEDGLLKPENILLVGIRNPDQIEIKYLKEKSIRVLSCKEVFEKGIKWTSQEILSFAKKDDLPLYCSFDIDVIDPAFAPGTGWIEPGGLTSRESLYLIQELSPYIHSADIVEVNPPLDLHDMTSQLAAKILVEFFK